VNYGEVRNGKTDYKAVGIQQYRVDLEIFKLLDEWPHFD